MMAEGDAAIVDPTAEEDTIRKVPLAETIVNMRHGGLRSFGPPFLSSHFGRKLLEDCGFQSRRSCGVDLLTIEGKLGHPGNDRADQW
jgi:hypothetical protein